MLNKWLLRGGSLLFAFALVTGCATNDEENMDQPEDAPMEEDEGDMMDNGENGENGGNGGN
jgi:hypothetical protein